MVRKGHFSCSSITDFSPSAVQSATIQPQSRVLKGKPPWGRVRRAQQLPPDLLSPCTEEVAAPQSHPLCPNCCPKHPSHSSQLQLCYLVHMAIIFLVVGWVLRHLQRTRATVRAGRRSLQRKTEVLNRAVRRLRVCTASTTETPPTGSARLAEPEELMGVLEAGREFRDLLGFCLEMEVHSQHGAAADTHIPRLEEDVLGSR